MSVGKALVVYFSGTGGTARAADAMEAALASRGVSVDKREIRHDNVIENGDEDLLVLLFAVHALNAPEPVYRWLESMADVQRIPAAVLSVSGGGEVFPNKACRVSSIKRLEKKGYGVTYEDMLVMPSNMNPPTPDSLAVQLLEVLPLKAEDIAHNLMAGVSKRSKPGLLNRILSVLCEIEKYGAHWFGKAMYADESCTGCGRCAKQCPSGNITMADKTPEFGGKCVMCFRCVYGCPEQAIKAKLLKGFLNQQGFDIDRFDTLKAAQDEKTASIVWKGVSKYLHGDGSSHTDNKVRTVSHE